MAIQVRYEDAEVTRLLAQIEAKARNPRPLLASWGERLKNSVRRNILEGGRPVKFAPLKPVTVRNWLFSRSSWWTKAGNLSQQGRGALEGRRPLLDKGMSGGLLGSINQRIRSNSEVVVGSDKVYAAIHHFGGQTRPHVILPKRSSVLAIPGIGFRRWAKHPGSRIPARPYLLIQDEDWLYLRQSALLFLLGGGAYK